jgi:putative ABC transport system substrate-binding protein
MRRREFLALATGALIWPSKLVAQQSGKVPRVGYLFSFTTSEGHHLWEACRQGLRDLGYEEGRTIVLEPRWAEGDHGRLPALAAELVRLNVDVIVSVATPASLAAKAATNSIPIVIVAVGEPVETGLISSLARPGGNITGLSLLTSELTGKRLELLAVGLQAERLGEGRLQLLVFGITGHSNITERSLFPDNIQQLTAILEPELKLLDTFERSILQLGKPRLDRNPR